MVSAQLKRLLKTFEGWSRGEPMTLDDWAQFGRDLKDAWVKVALLELGIELREVDLAAETADPGTNVVVLQQVRRQRAAEIDNGGGS